MNKKYLYALAAYILILLTACSCSGLLKIISRGASDDQIAAPHDQWDRAFSRRSGWAGGDVASSFIIPNNRVLWVFGDTFVGDVENNRRVRATLVNNSIAVHPYDPGRPGDAPSPDEMRFYRGPDDESGNPTAWVRPKDRERPDADASTTWYWPTGGGVLLPGPQDDYSLALFLILLEKEKGADSIWGFRCVGSAVAIIDNVEDPAPLWKTRVIELPHRIDGNGADAPSDSEVDWGVASLLEPSTEGAPGRVFIYGVTSDRSNNRDLVLARSPPDNFEDFEEWEFIGGDGQWRKSPGKASPVARGVAGELSVDKMPGQCGGMHYVMVYSEPLFGNRIFVRIAEKPEGPWSEVKTVFSVSGVQKSETLFTYAAKGHASLSGPGKLLISYIVNSHQFSELANDASIYRPRFITVPIAGIEIR
jgi:hypothetical protein